MSDNIDTKKTTSEEVWRNVHWSTVAAWEIEVARLAKRRQNLNWSQEDLSFEMLVHSNSIGRWERLEHPPSIENWLDWRRALGLPSPWPITTDDLDLRATHVDKLVKRQRKK